MRTDKMRFFITVIISFVFLFVFSVFVYALVGNSETDKSKNNIETVESNKTIEETTIEETLVTTTKNTTKKCETTTLFTTKNETTTTKNTTNVTTTKPAETENLTTYSENDLYYLAVAICREAGGESEEIQLLVANVIVNRVNSEYYPNTIYDVLTQYMQYGTMWRDGIYFPDWVTEDIKEQCYCVAENVLNGKSVCPDNVLYQAEFEQGSGIYKYFEEGYYFCYY